MMALSPYAAYETVQTTTADPARVVLLLLEGAARFLSQAQAGLAHGDIGTFAYKTTRAHAIVAELSGSLDRQVGGEVAANLDRLYDFMLRHLSQGLIAKSATHLGEVRGILQELYEGFEQAIDGSRHVPA
jgi:flagellar secretion chaperone FliS